MKILAASDIHGDSKLVKKLAEKADKEKVDLIVLCGDILGWQETSGIIKPFKDKNKKVLIIPGNWDSFATTDFLAQMYGVKNEKEALNAEKMKIIFDTIKKAYKKGRRYSRSVSAFAFEFLASQANIRLGQR
jgi:putative phosphoesterase